MDPCSVCGEEHGGERCSMAESDRQREVDDERLAERARSIEEQCGPDALTAAERRVLERVYPSFSERVRRVAAYVACPDLPTTLEIREHPTGTVTGTVIHELNKIAADFDARMRELDPKIEPLRALRRQRP